MTTDVSRALLVMHPTWSKDGDNGKILCLLILAKVDFIPTTPQRHEGTLMEPPVSVLKDTGTIPVATATAEPPLEPPDIREISHRFLDGP